MIKFIELETRIIELKDAKIDYFIAFYEQFHFLEKFKFVFLIFDGDYFYSTASYFELRNLSNQNELEYYFQYESFRSWKKTIDEETVKIFEKYPKIRLILAEEPDKDLKQCKFICKFPIIDKTKYNENILKLRNLLRMKGINSYYVKIPTENEVMQHPLFYYSFSDAFLWTKYKEKKRERSYL